MYTKGGSKLCIEVYSQLCVQTSTCAGGTVVAEHLRGTVPLLVKTFKLRSMIFGDDGMVARRASISILISADFPYPSCGILRGYVCNVALRLLT